MKHATCILGKILARFGEYSLVFLFTAEIVCCHCELISSRVIVQQRIISISIPIGIYADFACDACSRNGECIIHYFWSGDLALGLAGGGDVVDYCFTHLIARHMPEGQVT